jgi:predicted TIM-barrel fold metal-dependent hydrolase
MTLRAIDVHAHFSTREGTLSTLKYAQGIASYYMKREVTPEQVLSFSKSDEEMAQDFVKAGVKGIVVGWDAETNTGQPAMSNDYVASMVERFPEAFIGAYGSVDPWKGELAVMEAERCIRELGMLGIKFQGAAQAFYPNDHRFYPLWEKCVELGASIQLHTGTTGLGAGMPGGGGIKLKYTRPIPYIDDPRSSACTPPTRGRTSPSPWRSTSPTSSSISPAGRRSTFRKRSRRRSGAGSRIA